MKEEKKAIEKEERKGRSEGEGKVWENGGVLDSIRSFWSMVILLVNWFRQVIQDFIHQNNPSKQSSKDKKKEGVGMVKGQKADGQ